jgi:C4-dicarboxylate-specific signal transduction histidine kinase
MLKERHREVRFMTSFVLLALAGGIALLWPSVQAAAVERFGPSFPSRVLGGELLGLVVLFVIYLWKKTGQVEQLVARLLSEKGRGRELEELLAQSRAVLEASMRLNLDEDASASLQQILQCVTQALRAKRGVLWRQRADGRAPEREAVFPSTAEAPDPLALAFEDEVARKTLSLGATVVIDEKADVKEFGIVAPRPRKGWERLLAAPLLVDGKAVGVLLLCDPEASIVAASAEQDGPDASRLGLLEIFVGFAAGVLRNLRVFQTIAKRNEELVRARQLLCDHQRELAEIDAVSTMTRVAKSLAHGMSGPLTAISGYTDVVLTGKPDSGTLRDARDGLRREIDALKQRLHKVVEFTQTWRRAYGVVDLNQIVETAVALHAEPMRTRGVTCSFHPHSGLPYTVADPVRLRQVFHSLFSFVRDTLRDDAGRSDMRVRTLADAGTLRVLIDFPGRSGLVDVVGPLLDPNVEVATLAGERSLDLPVAVSILRDHQGDLEIETHEELGTRIIVQLPILSDAPESRATEFDPSDSLDRVLNRIFGDDDDHGPDGMSPPRVPLLPRNVVLPHPVLPLPTPAAPVFPMAAAPPATAAAVSLPTASLRPLHEKESRKAPSPPIAPAAPTPPAAQAPPPAPATPAASPARAAPAAPAPKAAPAVPAAKAAPAAPTTPAAPAAPATPPGPVTPAEPAGTGLNELFGPGEMWRGATPKIAPKRVHPDPSKKGTPRTLLEHAEVEGALKIFDEAEKAAPPTK